MEILYQINGIVIKINAKLALENDFKANCK